MMNRIGKFWSLLWPMSLEPGRRDASFRLTLFITTFMAMFTSITADFMFDDYPLIVVNPLLRDWTHLGELLRWGRPMRAITLFLDFQIWGEYAAGFRLTNLLLYFLCADQIYLLIKRLFKSENLAFLTAMFWLVMPVHVEAVVVITNRKEMLTLFFQLLAFRWYLDRDTALWKLPGSIFLFLLAILSKQVALILPLLILFHESLQMGREWKSRIGKLALILGLFFLLPLIGLLAGYEDLELYRYFQRKSLFTATHFHYLMTAPAILLNYLKICLFGVGLQVDYMPNAVTSPLSMRFWGPVLVLGALVALAWRARKSQPEWLWAAGWIVIHTIPIVNLIPQNYLMADRYFFTPSVGFALAFALCLREVWRRAPIGARSRKIGKGFLTLYKVLLVFHILILFNLTLFSVMYHWMGPGYGGSLKTWILDPVKIGVIFIYSLILFPSLSIIGGKEEDSQPSSRPLALAMMIAAVFGVTSLSVVRQGQWQPPKNIWEVERQRNPHSITALHNLAWYAERDGDMRSALENYQAAIDLAPNLDSKAYFSIGNILLHHFKDPNLSLRYFQNAILLESKFPEAYNGLAIAQIQMGNHQEALSTLGTLVQQVPDDANGRNNLAVQMYGSGMDERASEHFRVAIERQPDFQKAYWNYARLAWFRGKPEQAQALLEQANRYGPDPGQHRLLFSRLEDADRAIAEDRIGDAIEFCYAILQDRPDLAEVQHKVGLLLLKEEQVGAALEYLKLASRAMPRFANDYEIAQQRASKETTPNGKE